jgi:hypothetical protein
MPGTIACSTSYFALVLLQERATQSIVRSPACCIHRPRRAQYILFILLILLIITTYYYYCYQDYVYADDIYFYTDI